MNSRGQMTIEMLCLTMVFLIVALLVQKRAVEDGWVKDLVQGPWGYVQGMIEDGVWMKAGTSKTLNPGLLRRHGSLKGSDGDQS